MHALRHLPTLALLPLICAAANLTLHIRPNALLQNPSTLPSSTHAKLYSGHGTATSLLTRSNQIIFTNIDSGDYLLTFHCRDYAFSPLRVDVVESDGLVDKYDVEVHQTFLGNEWGNKGELRGHGTGRADVDVRAIAKKEFYMDRAGFSILAFLKNPMMLMAMVSLAMIVGMPYLMENMDEETKAEFEEMQKKDPISQASQSSITNFDLAGWMAGSSSGGTDDSAGKTSKSAGGGEARKKE